MKRPVIIILLYLLLVSLAVNSQSLSFKTYTASDGLVANPVRYIYQDSKGFIWIGTFDGLSRYDGYKFTNYTTANGLSHNFINSIIEINGKLLIAENNGAIDVFENGRIGKGFMVKSAANTLTRIDDRILIATDTGGFYEYINNKVVLLPQKKTGTPLGNFVSLNDSLLLGAGGDNKLIIYKKDLSQYSVIKTSGGYCYDLFQDSKKRFWACTVEGLKLLDIGLHREQPVSFSLLPPLFDFPPLNNTPVTSMIEEKDGSFWIGTRNGLVHLSQDGNYHVYNEKDGLPSAVVTTLYRDKENNLWVGTFLGLAKWVSKNHVEYYNTEYKDFKNDVSSIYFSSPEKILLRTYRGLQYFMPGTKEFKNISNTDPHSVPFSNYSSLVHTPDKISRLDSSTNRAFPVEKLDSLITGVLFATRHPNGTIFLGGFGGLFALDGSVSKKVLPHRITSLMIDKNDVVWAGTWQDGLFRIPVKTGDNNEYEVNDVSSTIHEKQIRGLFADSKNNIWVGTRYAGVFSLTPKGPNNFSIQHFNRQSGLMSDWVICFAETRTGDIWVGTYFGLDKLVKESSGYRVFNFSNAVNFFAEIKSIVSIGGDEWVCLANSGIAHFKDENIHRSAPLQAILLSGSHGVLDNKLTISFPSEKIFLQPNQNSARFEFSALGFINERQILYSYRLKGSSDTTWSKPENIHEAFYASLSPGNYTFEVRTIGPNGEPGKAATHRFTIATPFWKQWWFIGLCILLVAALIYSLYRYRIRQLLKLQQVRNNIATDLHDDIGSTLTNISILSELTRKNIQQPPQAMKYIQRITEEVTASGQALDDIIWSVNSKNDTLEETLVRMRRFAAELFDQTSTRCYLELQPDAAGKKLSMEQRRDLYLVYKESLNNIYKHASAKSVHIELSMAGNSVKLLIRDDGNGFDPEAITRGNGLINLRTRVEKWKGKINIMSAPGKGSDIEIIMPVA